MVRIQLQIFPVLDKCKASQTPVKFLHYAKHVLAMMMYAGWTKDMQGKLMAEATKTAALLGTTTR